MRSARILIVTASHLCRNPRVVKEASTLGAAGYDVTVLGIASHPKSIAADERLAAGQPFRHVTLDQIGRTRAARAAALARRATVWFGRRLNRHTPFRTLAALGPGAALFRMAARIPSDLAIVHTELAAWVGLRLLRAGRRVAVDFEDWYSEDLLPADRRHLPLAKLRAIEGELMRRASYASTTSAALSQALVVRHGGATPIVLTNSFPLQEDPRAGNPGTPPSFCWFSQTLGPGRGLEDFVHAWTRTTVASRLVLIGDSRGAYADSLLAGIPREFRQRVEVCAQVPPDALPATIARHDIGLALEQASIHNRDLTITNKILQYLNAGLAVVATDTAGQREVLACDSAAGVILPAAGPQQSGAVLDALLSDRPALATRQRAARRLAETVYCWEREAPKLLAAVERALAVPAPA